MTAVLSWWWWWGCSALSTCGDLGLLSHRSSGIHSLIPKQPYEVATVAFLILSVRKWRHRGGSLHLNSELLTQDLNPGWVQEFHYYIVIFLNSLLISLSPLFLSGSLWQPEWFLKNNPAIYFYVFSKSQLFTVANKALLGLVSSCLAGFFLPPLWLRSHLSIPSAYWCSPCRALVLLVPQLESSSAGIFL